MRIVIDENLPPAMARSLAALFVGRHEIIHLRDRFGPRIGDAEWITTLSAEGAWIVISGDRRITRNKAEKRVFKTSRLIGFFLAAGLQKAPLIKQMERLLACWDTLETQARIVTGGSMFEVPMKTTKLRTL